MSQNPPYFEENIEVQGHVFVVKIFIERRSASRVSFTKKGIVMRISSFQNAESQRSQIESFKKWAIEHIEKNPDILTTKKLLDYQNGDKIMLMDVEFQLSIVYDQGEEATGKAIVENQMLYLKIPEKYTETQKRSSKRWLVMQLAKKLCLEALSKRIHAWNDQHFHKKLGTINIRDKSTSWGSCSSNGSINMSVHLLKAPIDVIDYVIVHELAHLVEFNHSPQFWSVVKKVMPNYKEKEVWLKNNKYLYKF